MTSPRVPPAVHRGGRRRRRRRKVVLVASGIGAALALSACGGDDGGRLTVYSGRSEELIGPLLDRFAEETGTEIDVFYDGSTEVALKLDAEGDKSPADVFLSQAPGPLGFLDDQGRFEVLSDELLDQVDPAYRAADGDWVGVSARARVLAFDPERTAEDTLPASVLDLTSADYEGRVGIAPTNASFQDWISALRVEIGDEATSDYLAGLAANGARTYPNNLAVVDAVDRGEVDFGLVNHYYVLEVREQDPDLSVGNHFFPADDPGSLVLVSGVAVLDTSERVDAAEEFVDFLLSTDSQQYLAEETREFPLAGGATAAAELPPLTDVATASVDLADLGAQFSSTVQLIEDAGFSG
jgi:iron(III) transport system substrate-binding protein